MLTAAMFLLPGGGIASPDRVDEVPAPPGYSRADTEPATFARFVQTLPLSPGTSLRTWEGKAIDQGFEVLAVVNLPLLFKQDLEQCADWAMRLWAEYHKAAGRLQRLALYNYDGSRKRYRGSGESFEEFLRLRMAYSNSHSLKKGALPVSEEELMPGDLIVQNETGGIGHVSVILDMARPEDAPEAPPLFLIGFSFMPAQEFHVERAGPRHGTAGWFTLEGFRGFLRERLNLGEPVLRRFSD